MLGEKKRTLKLLVAIAHGAWVLTPDWVLASLEAGCWLPEAAYESTEFPGARRSREVCVAPPSSLPARWGVSKQGLQRVCEVSGGQHQYLLQPPPPHVIEFGFCALSFSLRFHATGTAVYQAHASASSPPLLGAHSVYLEPGSQLRPLVTALGGDVARSMQQCTLAIVNPKGDGGRPKGLKPGTPAVRDEWLLLATTEYELPDVAEWSL